MFDLTTIVRINNQAVQKHGKTKAREASLRKRLAGKVAAKKLANFTTAELEHAAFYLL
jgi:hypothetical protein